MFGSTDAKTYNINIKKISKELGLDRKIEFVFNKMNSIETEYEYKPLHECITQYFTRHTLVNYMVDAGHSDEEIIEITGHVSTDILSHYKKKHDINRKQAIIDKADKAHGW